MADITITNNISGSSTTITPTYDETTNTLSINVKGTVTRNYLFDVKATYVDSNGATQEVDFVNETTGLQANVTITDADVTQEITITGEFVRSVRMTDNTTNCTNSFSKAYRTTESSISGAVQPIKGYTFDETEFNIQATYTDKYGSTVKKKFTRIDGNTATATFSMSDVKSSNAITITGTAQEGEVPTGVTIDNQVSDTTVSYSYDESTNVLILSLTGSKSKNYMFGVVVAYQNTDGETTNAPLDIASDGQSATITITDCDVSQTLTITGEYVVAHVIENNVKFCETNLASSYRATSDVMAVFTPNDGYYFAESDFNLKASYTNKFGESVTVSLTRVSENEATITITPDSGIEASSKIVFTGDAQVTPEDQLNLGTIYAYVVDDDILEAFSKKRYFRESGDYYIVDNDLGEYVNRIKRIYASVPKGNPTILKCGNYSTEIECNAIKNRLQAYNFGYIKLPLINGDSNDFNSTVSIMLPFVGIVSLDSSLLGHTVGLDLLIDVITGDGVFKLTSDGYPIKMYDCTPSQDVLYHTYDMTLIGGDKWQSPLLYGLDPYMVISYHESVTKDINNTTLQVDLVNVNGFAQFDNVDVGSVDCLNAEKEEIKARLTSGVYL